MTAKPPVYIDFCDFGTHLNKADNYFTRILTPKYDVKIVDKPDLLFHSHDGNVHRLYTCKKIYWTPESDLPDFNECDFALTSRYLDDPRHLRLPFYTF